MRAQAWANRNGPCGQGRQDAQMCGGHPGRDWHWYGRVLGPTWAESWADMGRVLGRRRQLTENRTATNTECGALLGNQACAILMELKRRCRWARGPSALTPQASTSISTGHQRSRHGNDLYGRSTRRKDAHLGMSSSEVRKLRSTQARPPHSCRLARREECGRDTTRPNIERRGAQRCRG